MDISEFKRESYGTLDLMIHKPSGYINVTLICKHASIITGKERPLKAWNRLEKSKETLEFLSIELDIPKDKLTFSIEGRYANKDIPGTYAHEDIILSVAMWADNNFYLKVSRLLKKMWRADSEAEIERQKKRNRIAARKHKKELEEQERKMEELRQMVRDTKTSADIAASTSTKSTQIMEEAVDVMHEMQEQMSDMQDTIHTVAEFVVPAWLRGPKERQFFVMCSEPIGTDGVYPKEYRVVAGYAHHVEMKIKEFHNNGFTNFVVNYESPHPLDVRKRLMANLRTYNRLLIKPTGISKITRDAMTHERFMQIVTECEQQRTKPPTPPTRTRMTAAK